MSTSSFSSSSTSESEDNQRFEQGGHGGGGGDHRGEVVEASSSSRSGRREPQRRRSSGGVWPEPFVEAVAYEVGIDASRSINRLAVATALFNLFQVCSTWRAVSRSDLLWQNLTHRVWNRDRLTHNTWRDEYIYHHVTANNFRLRRYVYTTLHFLPADNNNNNHNNNDCRRLALSDQHLAAGFADGVVRVFHLASRLHLSTLHPQQRNRLGQFSRAVSGIILSDMQVVFASLDGDIHVADINMNAPPPRRAHLGDVVNDGVLVDFTGCNRWWVGLYAGVPGRSFHVWNSETEELVFVGGGLTDPEAVMGWHLLTELTELVGRVRVVSRRQESAMACTSVRVMVFDLRNQGVVLGEEESRRGLITGCVDGNEDVFVIVDRRGVASVRRAGSFEEVCRFVVRGASSQLQSGQRGGGGVMGCINGGYAIIWVGGVIRVWEIEHGEYLYALRERMDDDQLLNAIVADERHVAAAVASSSSTHNATTTIIHLWDFGA